MSQPESVSLLLNDLVSSDEVERRALQKQMPDIVAASPEAVRTVIEFRLSQASVDQAFLTEAVPVLRELGNLEDYRHTAVWLLGKVSERAVGETADTAETAVRGILRTKRAESTE